MSQQSRHDARQRRHPPTAGLTVLLVVLLGLMGCGLSAPAPGPTPTTDPSLSYRFPAALGTMTTVWQAADGIDLTSPEATLVRAFFESRFISRQIGLTSAFPGFYEFAVGVILDRRAAPDSRFAGSRRLLLVDIHATGGVLDAQVCDDTTGLYRPDLEGQERPPASYDPSDGRRVMWQPVRLSVKMRRIGVSRPWPSVVDRGEDRAPNWNIFSGWQLIRVSAGDLWPNLNLCQDWGFRNYTGSIGWVGPNLERLYPPGPVGPPFQATLPQSPGWTQLEQP